MDEANALLTGTCCQFHVHEGLEQAKSSTVGKAETVVTAAWPGINWEGAHGNFMGDGNALYLDRGLAYTSVRD